MSELLTTHQVQDLLKVDRSTIYRMVEAGRLPAIRVGKQWRFDSEQLHRWLSERAILATLSAPTQPAFGLAALLPLGCVQMIQDAFAEALEVMMLTTDMSGQPFTMLSQPCGFFSALVGKADALIGTWQQLAIYSQRDVVKPERDFVPPGVEFIVSPIELIEPERRRVRLSKDGRSLDYDFLVIATGTHIRPDQKIPPRSP
jgi:excisionase family DNA binding protein